MEESVVHDLLDIVVDEFPSDLAQIVSLRQKAFSVIHRTAAYILHYKYPGSGVLMIQFRTPDIADPLVVVGELLHIGGFLEKVHLFLRSRPQLIQDHFQIHDILEAAHRRKQIDRPFEKTYVSGHDVIDALALYLDNDIRPVEEFGLMYLCYRSRSERLLIDRGENIVPVLSVGAVYDLFHRLEGHWSDLGSQFHQLITIALRQHVGVKRHDLSQLDICRAEFLQDRAQFLRRDTSCDVVFAEYRGDL